jgi:HEAT repeat protein
MATIESKSQRAVRRDDSGSSGPMPSLPLLHDLRALAQSLADADWQTRRSAALTIASAVNAQRLTADEESWIFKELMQMIGSNRDVEERAAASAALEAMPTKALPPIIARLRSEIEDTLLRVALARVLGQIGGAEIVHTLGPLTGDADANLAATAVAALGRARSSEATTFLLAHLEDENDWLRFAAISALGELGDERAVAQLESLLDDTQTEEIAASALADIASLEAVRALARHLFDLETSNLRPQVLKAMISIVADEQTLPRIVARHLYTEAKNLFIEQCDERTIDNLIAISESSDVKLASVVITALGWSGGDEERVFSVIRNAFASPAKRKAARRALVDLARDEHSCHKLIQALQGEISSIELAYALGEVFHAVGIEALARLYADTTRSREIDAETREQLAGAIEQVNNRLRFNHTKDISEDDRQRLIIVLFELIKQADESARIKLAEMLGLLAHDSQTFVIEELREVLPAGDGAVEVLARLAFYEGYDQQQATKEALRALRHPVAAVRLRAINDLEQLAPGDFEIQSLIAHLTDESPMVRRAALRALQRAPATGEQARALQSAFADEDIWVRAEAVFALGSLFGNGDSSVRSLLQQEAMEAAHPLVRVAAVRALTVHAQTEDDWRQIAHVARKDARPEVRRAAVLAFQNCQQKQMALAFLRATLKDEHWTVRHAAVETLVRFKDERSARKLLIKEAAGAENSVRGAAIDALGQINAPEVVSTITSALNESIENEALIENATNALVNLARTGSEEVRGAIHSELRHVSPRAETIIRLILSIASRAA